MRGGDKRTGELFSYVDLEQRVRSDHPLRAIRGLVNEALVALEHEFFALYAPIGRPSIPPEKLLRAMLLQAFYSIRSERQLMERLEFDLLFRWFVGLGAARAASVRPWITCSRWSWRSRFSIPTYENSSPERSSDPRIRTSTRPQPPSESRRSSSSTIFQQ